MGKFLLMLILFIPFALCAQVTKMVEYNPDFKFTEGVYLSFEQFKMNKPLPKNQLIVRSSVEDMEFFARVLSEQEVQFYNEFGIKQAVKTSDIWGYSRKGLVFVNVNGSFHRMPVIGSLCYFAATVEVMDSRGVDPFDPYYSMYVPATTSREELKQFILKFDTGDLIDYSYQVVEELLKSDEELYAEYKGLKKKMKKQKAFVFIRRYNEKHPVSFPVY